MHPESERLGSAKARTAAGLKLRRHLRRVEQKHLRIAERKSDPIDLLLSQSEGRLQSLLPIKYKRMSAGAFAFFRGSAIVMAHDLGRLPHSGLTVQLCGDAHVQNLGSYAGPDGRLIFDFNDFDETIRGPWEWDVKRMATSLVLAGREVPHKRGVCHSAAEAFVAKYVASMSGFATQPILQVARHQIHRERNLKVVSSALEQSRRATPLDLLAKLTEPGPDKRPRLSDHRPVSWRIDGDDAKQVLASLDLYRDSLRPESLHLFNLFHPLDVGFKVVGTGSVGMRDYIVLMEGNGKKDPLFLQIKQELQSVYAPFLPSVAYDHEGKRVALGQRSIQTLSDLLLGWTSVGGYQFLVRQLNDHKGTIDLTQLRGDGLMQLAEVAGELLARGHARSGDACKIHGYCGSGTKLERSIREFASQYADQTEADFAAFKKAIASKKIPIADNVD